MKLPWYVALDRWIRRNPRLCSTLQGIVTLATVPVITSHLDNNTTPLEGLAIIAVGVGVFIYATALLLRQVLEVFSDEWREGG